MKSAMTEPITVEILIMKTPCNKEPFINSYLHHDNSINIVFNKHNMMFISKWNFAAYNDLSQRPVESPLHVRGPRRPGRHVCARDAGGVHDELSLLITRRDTMMRGELAVLCVHTITSLLPADPPGFSHLLQSADVSTTCSSSAAVFWLWGCHAFLPSPPLSASWHWSLSLSQLTPQAQNDCSTFNTHTTHHTTEQLTEKPRICFDNKLYQFNILKVLLFV